MMKFDLLDFIKSCIQLRKIRWTYHVNMRLKGRFISREAVLSSLEKYEIIEEYPEDKYLPSVLIYTTFQGEIFHIQIATDYENNYITIVTAYRPDPFKWEKDFKTRRSHDLS